MYSDNYFLNGAIITLLAIAVSIIIFKKGKLSLTPKPLNHQPLFWVLGIIFPITLFLYFGSFVWDGNTFCLSEACYSNFFNASKLPLGLLSLSIPLVSIINNIHRTIQTNEQIERAKDRNKYDQYYSHEKNFIEKINEIKEIEFVVEYDENDLPGSNKDGLLAEINVKMKINRPYYLYKKLFKNNAPGRMVDYVPDVIFIEDIKKLWEEIEQEVIKSTNCNKYQHGDLFFYQVPLLLANIFKKLTLEPYTIEHYTVFYNDLNDVYFETYILSVNHLTKMLRNTFLVTNEFLGVLNEDMDYHCLDNITKCLSGYYTDTDKDPWNFLSAQLKSYDEEKPAVDFINAMRKP